MADINREQVKDFQVEQAVKHATAELNTDDQGSQYIETDLELKSFLIDPKAKLINGINVPDLVLGTIKDKAKIKQLEYWLELQVTMLEAGMVKTARYYENLILTTLNFRRSEDGAQQKFLISRIKAQKLELEDDKGKVQKKVKQGFE